MKRGETYEAYKERFSQRLLNHLFEHFPHLKDKIDCYELSTPLTTKHFVNYEHGELYGLEHTPDRYKQKFLNPRTPIKGLFLTGQDIVTAGVGGGPSLLGADGTKLKKNTGGGLLGADGNPL